MVNSPKGADHKLTGLPSYAEWELGTWPGIFSRIASTGTRDPAIWLLKPGSLTRCDIEFEQLTGQEVMMDVKYGNGYQFRIDLFA